ncbi:Glucosidase YgjK [Pelomyxa schiedti]|nr:Glucosidase YgjK [Pelomyxa schiedti]
MAAGFLTARSRTFGGYLVVVIVLLCAVTSWGSSASKVSTLGQSKTPKNAAVSAPLHCGDLAVDDVYTISYSGAHHYLNFDPFSPGLGALNYRQFSDWSERRPMFHSVLDVLVEGNGPSQLDYYMWRPDYITINAYFTEYDLQVAEQVAYLDSETAVAWITLTSLSTAPITVDFFGQVDFAANPVISASSTGVQVNITARLSNPWGEPAEVLEKTFAVGLDFYNSATINGNEYTFSLVLGPGEQRSLVAAISSPSLSFPIDQKAIDDTTATIDLWLDEVEIPDLEAENDLITYYTAWFQFWYNTEHADGYWVRDIVTPSKSTYGRGVWLWDTGFHVFALLLGGENALQLAKNQIIVLTNASAQVGHLPREVWVGVVGPDVQPPGILTWASLELYKKTQDIEFIRTIYPALAANNEWFYQNRDYQGTNLCQWEGTDSGWDTSPRWDNGIVEAIDLNCWLGLDQKALSEMASLLNLSDDASKWLSKWDLTSETVQQNLWDENMGLFFDRNPNTKELYTVVTPASFWSMLAGVATVDQCQSQLVVMKNSSSLWLPYPMPVVAATEPTFDPSNYWRGPTWININWLTIVGLERYGFEEEADDLQERSISIVGSGPTPREYYNPLTEEGLGAYNYMWTGALYIVMVNDYRPPPP